MNRWHCTSGSVSIVGGVEKGKPGNEVKMESELFCCFVLVQRWEKGGICPHGGLTLMEEVMGKGHLEEVTPWSILYCIAEFPFFKWYFLSSKILRFPSLFHLFSPLFLLI